MKERQQLLEYKSLLQNFQSLLKLNILAKEQQVDVLKDQLEKIADGANFFTIEEIIKACAVEDDI